MGLLKTAVAEAQEDLETVEMEYANYTVLEVDGDGDGDGPGPEAAQDLQAKVWPPMFSKFDDKQGYNGRVISKFAVDSIATTVFNQRKAFMEAKMKCLCAVVCCPKDQFQLQACINDTGLDETGT
jgi:hypothetical protein